MKIYPFCDDLKLLIEFNNKERAELQEAYLTFPEEFNDLKTIEYFLLEPAFAHGYHFGLSKISPFLESESTKIQYFFRRYNEISPLEDLLNLGFCVFHQEI